jgi:Ca2+-binding RTX toxin-like protein
MQRGVRIIAAAIMLGGLVGSATTPAVARAGHGCRTNGTNSTEVLTGTAGADRICALAGDDVVESLDGNDRIWAGSGNDTVEGDDGNDRIFGGAGNDTLDGNAGTDVVRGGAGDDVIHVNDAGPGDRAIGGKGADTCFVNQADKVKGCEQVHVVL